MARLLVGLFAMALFAAVGCQKDGDGGSMNRSGDAMPASADVCPHCPGVQKANAAGECPECAKKMSGATGASAADACAHCAGVQTATADGKCSACGGEVAAK